MKLPGIKVLVTRPRPQGEALCEAIRIAGGIPIYLPTIEIIPTEQLGLFQKLISQLDQFNWIIFTSPQAVIHSIESIYAHWPTFPKKVKIASIGQGTAIVLEKSGLSDVLFPQEDWCTEGLLALDAFQQGVNQKIAIISGANGRELLAQALKERGAEVTEIIAYRRQLPKINKDETIHLFASRSLDIIVSTSRDSIENLLLLAEKDHWVHLFSIPLIVVSERIASYAKQVGFKTIVSAKNASHEHIIHAVETIANRGRYGS